MAERPSLFKDPGFPDGEGLILQKSSGGRTYRIETRLKRVDGLYRIEVEEEDTTTLLEMEAGTLASRLLEKKDRQGNLLKSAIYSGGKVELANRTAGWVKELHAGYGIYDQDSLYYLLRGFPFGSNRIPGVGLVQHEKGGIALMTIREQGIERIGDRDCYKLELKLSGWVGLVWPYPYRFWFDRRPPHPFVKYEGMTGDKREVERIELMEYREGLVS